MTADSEWLLAFARHLEARCPPHLASEIAVTGSAARLDDANAALEDDPERA